MHTIGRHGSGGCDECACLGRTTLWQSNGAIAQIRAGGRTYGLLRKAAVTRRLGGGVGMHHGNIPPAEFATKIRLEMQAA